MTVRVSEEVQDALADGRPVVALESTIVTHGMAWPANVETAHAVEGDVRAGGAVPATVAVIDGELRVGLPGDQIERLARDSAVAKLSRADLAACLASGRTGSTTVAATMIAARAAGIEVFATGGIGGVHRGADRTWDVSADLHELGRTPVTVVCAGAKAILDLPRTLEVLETLGVPVIAFGQDALPAFWSRDSGFLAPLRMDDPAQIAAAHRLRGALGIDGGQVVAVPIPVPDEIPAAELQPHIDAAIAEADRRGIGAKEVTPFLLSRIVELTGGASLRANIALVRNNAAVAARIAGHLAALPRGGALRVAPPRSRPYILNRSEQTKTPRE